MGWRLRRLGKLMDVRLRVHMNGFSQLRIRLLLPGKCINPLSTLSAELEPTT